MPVNMDKLVSLDRAKEIKTTENGMIATVEASSTASKAYAVGDYFYYTGKLYKATAAIASGGTITPGTNCALAKLGDDVGNLKSALKGVVAIPIADESVLTDRGRINYSNGEVFTGSSLSTSYSDYVDVSGCSKIIFMQMVIASSSAPSSGTAFYDGEKVFTGDAKRTKYNAPSTTSELEVIEVPEGAKYARFTYWLSSNELYSEFPFVVYDYDEYNNQLTNRVEKNEEDIANLSEATEEAFSRVLPINTYDGKFYSGYILVSDGSVHSSANALYTDYVDVSSYTKIRYTRIATTASTATWGMTFYDENKDHIDVYQKPILNAETYSYVLSDIDVPTGAKYARFTWNSSSLTEKDFAIYDYAQIEQSMYGEIEKLKSYHPDYLGKKLSIVGDSISTFCPASDKVNIDGHNYAPEGCTTNYPGNCVQYENSNVNSVADTWWGKLLEQFGMVLGINESYAGSMIAWNGTAETYRYGANKCMCSEYRIGHLDDNGTPDLIIVYGGTNDTNHYKDQGIPIGSLDIEHDPMDFDNFPMITTTYYGAVTTMLLRIQHSYPNAMILCVLPFFVTDNHANITTYDLKQHNDAMIEVCDYLGVEYVDLRKIINLYDIDTLLFDDLHPNAAGMSAIAKAVIHKLNDML